jgi:hypothetical protein
MTITDLITKLQDLIKGGLPEDTEIGQIRGAVFREGNELAYLSYGKDHRIMIMTVPNREIAAKLISKSKDLIKSKKIS